MQLILLLLMYKEGRLRDIEINKLKDEIKKYKS